MSSKPVIWSIAGSDSGGGAGIQADLLTIHALGGHGATIISAITAQNSVTVKMSDPVLMQTFSCQLEALAQDIPPAAIKIGLLPTPLHVELLGSRIAELRRQSKAPLFVVYDPVFRASSGNSMADDGMLQAIRQYLLPQLDLITPNADEFGKLTGLGPDSKDLIQQGIDKLLQLGCQGVLLKGGHLEGEQCVDRYYSQQRQLTLSSPRINTRHGHGTGCTLSSAIATAIALDYPLEDALVIAKAYLNQGLRSAKAVGSGPGPIAHLGWPTELQDFPQVTDERAPLVIDTGMHSFASCDTERLGLYPVVDSSAWIEKLLQLGVKTVQLRIKEGSPEHIESEVTRAIMLGRDHRARVFINDYWQLALKHQAYGIHLGQEDLQTADLNAIRQGGLRLGLSTHGYFELLRARALRPSYIALGHIFPTTTKEMPSKPQGLERLARYQGLLQGIPTVAIGGIDLERARAVADSGVGSIAVVRAVTQAHDLRQTLNAFNEVCDG
ncbi:thiamine phosphate synthase [Dongshaea marina]|uniref:thiamine phosphate synthase n=1 Tax=Dongshaea marina TaxID=2047966 RepID=UPI000D3E415D|nr:thiamine phosphate synthase [Dongshaea marina]